MIITNAENSRAASYFLWKTWFYFSRFFEFKVAFICNNF